MKTDTRQYLGWAARFRLFGRVLGLTGLFAAMVGLFVLLALGRNITMDNLRADLTTTGTTQWATILLLGGAALATLIVLLELISWLGGSGQRSATGLNASAQILLALAVFAGVNVLAFNYFKRWDMTRDKEFTLNPDIANELRKLQGKTTIIVLQQHKTFGQLSPKPDIYDYAAERKVVDKVHDLVDEFRLLGPQFHVVTLDVEAIGYDNKLDEETAKRPGLKEAIAAAPENSIFFYPDDRVETITADEASKRTAADSRVRTQADPKDANIVYAYAGNIPRLSFNEFYQLDKTASKAANPGPDGKPQGNLVLRPQGVEAFAGRVLAIQEKRPKVGLLVIHEAFSTNEIEGWPEQYTNSGLRKSLEDHGFDVEDVLLKKWSRDEEPKPAAYNLDETRYNRLDAEVRGIETQLRNYRAGKEKALAFRKELKESTLEQLNDKYRARLGREITEEVRELNIRSIDGGMAQIDEDIAQLQKNRAETEAKVEAVMRNDRAFADSRVTDIKAKLGRLVADCDLLIVLRSTLINLSIRPPQAITPSIYRLNAEQTDVIKEFMKKGKPVLACVGPDNEPDTPPSLEPLDDFERLLGERGIELGRQTVLFDSEIKSFADHEADDLLGGSPVQIPPISYPKAPAGKEPNPIAKAMRATASSADRQLDLRLRHPRPIYVEPVIAKRSRFAVDFMATAGSSWNDDQPFPVERRISPREIAIIPPRYVATPFDDPKKGTHDEERRGPFTVAVAIESALPIDWYDQSYADYRKAGVIATPLDGGLLAACLTARSSVDMDKDTKKAELQTERKTGRLVVIGQGGVFTGKQLSPAHEQLLLHTCNWLLKRDDRLPRTDKEWQYPRVHRDERESFLWEYGPFLGLPALFLYLGLIVWIVRRVR